VDGMRFPIFPSITPVFAAAAVACSLACTGTAGLAQRGTTMIAIEKMDIGTAPADFDFAGSVTRFDRIEIKPRP